MKTNDIVIKVFFGNSLSCKTDCNQDFEPLAIKSAEDKVCFDKVVEELQKFVSWDHFDSVEHVPSSTLLESRILLKINGVCNAQIIFRKVDDADYNDMKFIVYSDFQPDLDSAAYWLRCMLD